MGQTQWYGWAPPPYRKPGKFDWLNAATENYFASKQRGQQGLERSLQQQDLQAMNQPGFNWNTSQPQSLGVGMMKAKQGIRQAYPTPYEQALQGRINQPKLPENVKSMKSRYRKILENEYADDDIEGVEFDRKSAAMDRFLNNPNNWNATPEQVKQYYDSLTPEAPPKPPGLARRMGTAINEAIKPTVKASQLGPPQVGMGSGLMAGGRTFGAKKKLDPGTAQSILAEAGGDKEKAREIARSRGYEF